MFCCLLQRFPSWAETFRSLFKSIDIKIDKATFTLLLRTLGCYITMASN